MNEFNKKIIVSILTIIFVFSPVFAIPAQAQWVIYDPMDSVKNYGLDAFAWTIVILIMERMTASTVNWINGGFKGSPAFVTDPEAYFKDIGDKVAGQYIFSNPNLNFLCGPIQAKIRLALTQNYNQDRVWQCTLTQVGKNMDDFMNNFENGGWDNLFELTQRQQNNPIGAYLQAQNELNLQIATRQGTKQKELDWGNGFMSFNECTKHGVATTRTVEEGGRFELQADGSNKYIEGTKKQVTDPPPCISEKTSTPGSVISDQLNKQLGLGQDKLVVADEINEIVSALLNKLVSSVVGGIGKGLRSLSKPDATTGNQVFSEQLSTVETTVDYFGSSQNTGILDIPPPDPCAGVGVTPLCPFETQVCNSTSPLYNPADPSCTTVP